MKTIEVLKTIVKHNQMQMLKAKGDQSQAKDLYTISHEGQSIYDFFSSENFMEDVNPLEYYPIDKLRDVGVKWLSKEVK